MKKMIHCFVCLMVTVMVCNLHAEKPQIARDYKKVVFIGNSITKHGPSKKVDWSGNWEWLPAVPRRIMCISLPPD